jgi:hypothetical protein
VSRCSSLETVHWTVSLASGQTLLTDLRKRRRNGFTFASDLRIPPLMRPEITRAVDDIQQAIALLRRHL